MNLYLVTNRIGHKSYIVAPSIEKAIELFQKKQENGVAKAELISGGVIIWEDMMI